MSSKEDRDFTALRSFLYRYQSKRILLVGERLDFLFAFLMKEKFAVTALSLENKSDGDVFSLCNEMFEDSHEAWPVDLLLANDGGRTANLAKLLSLQSFYRDDVKDFFKKDVEPFNALPLGIYLGSSCDGNEIDPVATFKDSKHRFIYGLINPLLRPVFVVPSNNLLTSLQDKVSLFLKTGNKEAFGDISLRTVFLFSQQPVKNPTLEKIKNLSRIVLGKVPGSSLTEAVASVLPFINASLEKEELESVFLQEGVQPIQLDASLKTKLKEKASPYLQV